MGSWVKTITSPFRKACNLFNPPRDNSQIAGHDHQGMKLHCEVMACAYEDVHVMWSILDKSKSTNEAHNLKAARLSF
ncbi:hypothetical protein IHE45_19G193300 [Dioscorea alata]|uniref:Uncharacterized protein n=1 Tax=Dioscorea alata TaxID=55571 RepID=A0ACB7U4H2_DIOAL|nr:hypothetical protein IHE45_19G193300 [Dioscorea alata]